VSRRDATQATSLPDVVVTSKDGREATARARMEALYGRRLSDDEWARVAQTLHAFATVVTRWNQQESASSEVLRVPVAIPAEQG